MILLSDHMPSGSYGVLVSPVSIRLPNRRTVDAVDWWLDVTPLLSANTNDYVLTARTLVTPSGTAGDMVVSDVKLSGTAVGFLLSGGRDGIAYTVVATLVTLSGRTFTVEMSTLVAGVGLPVDYAGSVPWPQDVPLEIRVKRGATLIVQMTFYGGDDEDEPVDLTGSVVTGQIRTAGGYRLVEDLNIVVTSEPTVAEFTVLDTTAWPVGAVVCDLQLTYEGATQTSDTFPIFVDRPVTQ